MLTAVVTCTATGQQRPGGAGIGRGAGDDARGYIATMIAMFTGFHVNLYADDVEPGVAFHSALGFEESYRYAPAGDRCAARTARAAAAQGQ